MRAMVCPVPSQLSWSIPYAPRIWAGVRALAGGEVRCGENALARTYVGLAVPARARAAAAMRVYQPLASSALRSVRSSSDSNRHALDIPPRREIIRDPARDETPD